MSEHRPDAAMRSRLVAGLLSLIAPGVGQLYAGRAARGLLLFGLLLAIQAATIVVAFLIPPRFDAFVIFVIVAVAIPFGVYLFILIDAVRLARRADVRTPRPRWYVLLGATVAVWAGFFVANMLNATTVPLLPWRIFSIPSTSMQPTLKLGEWLLADTRHYANHAPARGDLVIYRLPRAPDTMFVKRIVALAGDRVEFRDGRTFVNGAAASEPFADTGNPKAFLNNMRELVVPAGHIFAVGDNRANSADSRLPSHGPIPLANLVARAAVVLYPATPDRAGLRIGTPAP